ncbi:MAG: LamG domain-containing protein [Nanoarchaeota archaeon]|nr:LamG domain-containing protein [Nanoarchaeota archaeon]
MNKKALSGVITTLIIIVLVIVAIAIIWAVVKPYIQESTSGIATGKFTIDLELENVALESSENTALIGVKRNKGEASFSGIKFIFSDGTSSEIFDEETNLSEFQKKSFNFTLNELDVESITEVSIAPIFISNLGKKEVGNPIDSYVITGNNLICGSTCGGLGYECGIQTICGKEINCDEDIEGCDDLHLCTNGLCTLKTTGFVSWWNLDGNAEDSINNNDGLVSGAISTSDAKYGQAYSFNGNHIEILDNTDFDNFDSAFSVVAWAKPTSWDLNHNTIVGQETGFLLAIDSSGKLANWLNAGGSWAKDISLNPLISLNTWTHFAMSYDGVKIKSYVNGALQGEGQSKTGDMGTNNKVYVGKRNNLAYQPFHGIIDEVMIFNKTLTPEEIQIIYETGLE